MRCHAFLFSRLYGSSIRTAAILYLSFSLEAVLVVEVEERLFLVQALPPNARLADLIWTLHARHPCGDLSTNDALARLLRRGVVGVAFILRNLRLCAQRRKQDKAMHHYLGLSESRRAGDGGGETEKRSLVLGKEGEYLSSPSGG